jgi:hypothetical protein
MYCTASRRVTDPTKTCRGRRLIPQISKNPISQVVHDIHLDHQLIGMLPELACSESYVCRAIVIREDRSHLGKRAYFLTSHKCLLEISGHTRLGWLGNCCFLSTRQLKFEGIANSFSGLSPSTFSPHCDGSNRFAHTLSYRSNILAVEAMIGPSWRSPSHRTSAGVCGGGPCSFGYYLTSLKKKKIGLTLTRYSSERATSYLYQPDRDFMVLETCDSSRFRINSRARTFRTQYDSCRWNAFWEQALHRPSQIPNKLW